jgi:hypothetical protein
MNFQALIRRNRKYLVSQGFNYKTLWTWWAGIRVPKYETAVRLQKALKKIEKIEMINIPYYKVERKK